jgi:hypothetical protein
MGCSGDVSKSKAFGISSAAARVRFTDEFNLAPTLVGMYGHGAAAVNPSWWRTSPAEEVGLIDWTADTWTAGLR